MSSALECDILVVMNLGTSSQHSDTSHLLRIMLVALLMFAAWHVASHDLDISNDANNHTECQACRLNHVPLADLPVLSWALSLFLISFLLAIPAIQHTTQSYRYTLGARAPPLF